LSQLAGWPAASPTTGSVVQASQPVSHPSPQWIVNDEPGAFAQAASQGKPLMMDFYADWCAACKELDHNTYNQPEIISRAQGFISLKMDFTKQNDWSKQMIEKYGVKGMPTVIFFASDGQEKERFTGFKEAAEVAQIMDRVK
jgi:thioredoxin:protein disulfide reductase